MPVERELNQRHLGFFGVSVLLHALALLLIILTPYVVPMQELPLTGGSTNTTSATEAVYMDVKSLPGGDREASQKTATTQPEVQTQPIHKNDVVLPTKLPSKSTLQTKTNRPIDKAKSITKQNTPAQLAVSGDLEMPSEKSSDKAIESALDDARLAEDEREETIRAVVVGPKKAETEKDEEVAEFTPEEDPNLTQPENETEKAAEKLEAQAMPKPPLQARLEENEQPKLVEKLAVQETPETSTQPTQKNPALQVSPSAALNDMQANEKRTFAPSARATNQGASANGIPSNAMIGDGSNLTEQLGNPRPVYPAQDRMLGREGVVVFIAHVRADGVIDKIFVEKSAASNTLDASALNAFKKWRYKSPGRDQWFRKPFNFSLNGGVQEAPTRLRR